MSFDFIKRFKERRKQRKLKASSGGIAKKRLQFAIIYDKLEVSDNMLQSLHQDILNVISKYFEIDRDSLKIDIKPTDDLSSLVVNTHILRAKSHSKKKKLATAKANKTLKVVNK
ncbi:Septum formation topological specificity factor MinE [Candidatus Magnetomorum sp. HK-1]|nr:Septum formation topological specificity factor MinE [Candidatus Magnetomorum sp. HK-1]